MLISFPNKYAVELIQTTEKSHVGVKILYPEGSPILWLKDETVGIITTVEMVGLLNWLIGITPNTKEERVQVAFQEWLLSLKASKANAK